jgi:hypothetical protein
MNIDQYRLGVVEASIYCPYTCSFKFYLHDLLTLFYKHIEFPFDFYLPDLLTLFYRPTGFQYTFYLHVDQYSFHLASLDILSTIIISENISFSLLS